LLLPVSIIYKQENSHEYQSANCCVPTLLMTGAAQAAEVIDVYRDPNCGCCKANHLSSIATIMTL
jgi:hypothetical protein